MTVTAELMRSTPHSLLYWIAYDGQAGTDLIMEAVGGPSPDLLTDARPPLKQVLAQNVTSLEEANILLLGGSRAVPVTNQNVAGQGFTNVADIVITNRIILFGNTQVTWAAGPAWDAVTFRPRIYIQCFTTPNVQAIATMEVHMRHSITG